MGLGSNELLDAQSDKEYALHGRLLRERSGAQVEYLLRTGRTDQDLQEEHDALLAARANDRKENAHRHDYANYLRSL